MMDGHGGTGSSWTNSPDLHLEPGDDFMETFKIYETQTRYVIFGYNHGRKHWRLLKIDRTEPDELNFIEDPTEYTDVEKRDLLLRLAEGNKMSGGILRCTNAFGIVGFVKFLSGYHMVVVKARDQVGNICGHLVYRIVDTEMLPIPHPVYQTSQNKAEQRYKKLFMLVDLTRDFYFSYTYPIMQCLQRNAIASPNGPQMSYESMYVWNAFLSRKLREAVGHSNWTVAIVHGFFKQNKCSLNGRIAVVTLIARRSRHFAGTRYLKRGVNDKGKVANDVETEQILADDDAAAGMASGQITSAVQNRGSIPLFWSQQATQLTPKPDIVLQRYDPVYAATALHFKDLENRYGNPIVILNLIKTREKKPREMILRRGYRQAIDYLNEIRGKDQQLKFIHYDYNLIAKSKSGNVLKFLQHVTSECLNMVGFFYSGKLNSDVRRNINRMRRQRLSHQQLRLFGSHDFLHVQSVPNLSRLPRLETGGETAGSDGPRPAGGGVEGVASPSGSPRQLSGLVEFVVPSGVAVSPTASTMSENSEARASEDAFARSSTTTQPHDEQTDEALNNRGGGSRGLNVTPKDYAKHPTFQSGVLRTNCIDCLDRTNVAQYAYGMCALGRQLIALGLADEDTVDPDSKVAAMLIDMYTEMGDSLAIQYGGSAAHNTVLSEKQGKWTPTVQSHDMLKSIKRYISNVISDKDKQDGMNLFLGHFLPHEGKPAIWELESDYYLHVRSIETEDDTPTTASPLDELTSLLHIPGNHQEDLLMPEPPGPLELTSLDFLIKQRCGDLRQVSTYKDDAIGPSSPHEFEPTDVEVEEPSPLCAGYHPPCDEAASVSSNREEPSDEEDNNFQLLDEDELAAFFERYVSLEGLDTSDYEEEWCSYDDYIEAPSTLFTAAREDERVQHHLNLAALMSDEIPECFRDMDSSLVDKQCLDCDCDFAFHIGLPDYGCADEDWSFPRPPARETPQQESEFPATAQVDEAPSTDYTRYLRSWLTGNPPG